MEFKEDFNTEKIGLMSGNIYEKKIEVFYPLDNQLLNIDDILTSRKYFKSSSIRNLNK